MYSKTKVTSFCLETKMPKNNSYSYLALTPIIGIMAYVVLYYLGALKYAGGSFYFPDTTEYSFTHNLICDLMLPEGINGALNEGRPLGVISHMVLSASMIIFFYILPEIFTYRNRNTKLTRYIGMVAMIVFIFLFSEYHDIVVVLLGVFGTAALIPLFIEFKKHVNIKLIVYVYFCFFMCVLVLLSFLTKVGYYYLPLFQKLVFVFDAIWVTWICLLVYRNKKLELSVIHE